jgi:surfeit locus 1 family protein
VTGAFLNDRETQVQAVTDLGGGYWVMTPFRTDDGFTVLVNRGFVPTQRRDPATRPSGQITGRTVVTGLMRLTEPKSGFLHTNDPGKNRWYSRDVPAIAAARGLQQAAPYFIDADATRGRDQDSGGFPVDGLTVINFPNNHLIYALTWFMLALMLAGGALIVALSEYRLRRDRPEGA